MKQSNAMFHEARAVGQKLIVLGSIVSKIADEIKLHGSWEAYLEWEEKERAENSYICGTANSINEKANPISLVGVD